MLCESHLTSTVPFSVIGAASSPLSFVCIKRTYSLYSHRISLSLSLSLRVIIMCGVRNEDIYG
jgi:hypothetical protein